MARRRNIQVNELPRYTKTSEQLVLEEYSSCEVPAGCGGAIMRWIDPTEALPLHLWFYCTGKNETLSFDGQPMSSSRIDARPGKHVVAANIVPENREQALLGLALRFGDTDTLYSEPKRSPAIGHKIEILSGANARIVGLAKAPENEDWKKIDFDDSQWTPLTRAAVKAARPERDWHLDQVEKTGAQRIALPKARGSIWIRCTFDVELGAKS